jgi:dTDP-4-dehydrorhamnose reductase
MIILLGASGYIGNAFEKELRRRNLPFRSLSRREVDYTRFDRMFEFLQETKPSFLINAAGYTGKPNVDACEVNKADTLAGNVLFPEMLAHCCRFTQTPWGHVSSGCIYSGAKIVQKGKVVVEPDLTLPDLRVLGDNRSPTLQGFDESDEPNFTFRRPPCSFYSGTKALG